MVVFPWNKTGYDGTTATILGYWIFFLHITHAFSEYSILCDPLMIPKIKYIGGHEIS